MVAVAHDARRLGDSQEIRFCRTDDGVRLAYAVHGSGPPLVVVSCWLSHLQHDWQSPVWRHFLDEMGDIATVARYDERGFGLSDWSVTDFSLPARVADLEAIIDALGFERFALLGMSGGAPVAISYAARHPDRVSQFVLYGAIAIGCFGAIEDPAAEDAFRALIRAGWARPDNTFRRVLTSIFIPDADEIQMGWLDDLQRASTSTENAVASRIARQEINVMEVLPGITAPTLVMHARGDRASSLDHARDIAARIPGACFVPLDSRNHILLADEPAWRTFMAEVTGFLAPERAITEPRAGTSARIEALSPREREIVGLAAGGGTNAEIAGDLGISVRTVERHLSNAYLKLGTAGRTARTAAVAHLLRSERR
jgi:pimeloyl-ACP methyl ester carboxylesterase/DNA-binding CsgD family transcriptional regulator